jgi:hypothetical protein
MRSISNRCGNLRLRTNKFVARALSLYTGILVYSAAGLHNAVEQAAGCYSVNVSQCGSESATQTYAQNQYYGVNSPTFTASIQLCGHQVAATVAIPLVAVVENLSVPHSATACFP